jgi:phosphopantothenoylcysteine decarboxylase
VGVTGKISFVVAPAMNSFMYTHPLTEVQITILKSFSICVLPVVEKTLICGDKGIGAMAEVNDIVLFVNSLKKS